MESISCPRCGMPLSDEEIMRIRQQYASRKRHSKSGGRNGGRPVAASGPPSTPKIAALKDSLRAFERRVGVGSPVEVDETPYTISEPRVSWADHFRKWDTEDPMWAQEKFSELVKGRKLPAGFMAWARGKKIAWLEEFMPLP